MRYRTAFLLFLLSLPLHGCVADRPSRGWVQRAQIGAAYPDFVFVDDEGISRSLGNHLGDFTVLAFTRCDRDTHGPAAAILRNIITEHRQAALVKVVGIDIHWFDGSCDHTKCHLVASERDIQSVCDATGAVRRLYSANEADQYVVIGPDHRITMKVGRDGVADLRRRLKKWVYQLSEKRANEISQEYQSIGY
ncbi:MAG: hypothetical protein AMXMBFR20_31400 [Planctomycetia bacterium]